MHDSGAHREGQGPHRGGLREIPPPTGFLLHSASALHDTGWGHPEHQGRLRSLASTIGKDLLALHGHVVQVAPREATTQELELVHTPEHIERVRAVIEASRKEDAPLELNGDTVVSGASWDAAVGSVGAVITAVEGVVDGELSNAFVAARPPGHHATPSQAMGFCLFNSVAIAARWLQARGRAARVLIIDWDVHHGNGTQDAFYDDGTVFYLSLHQSPHYPGTGAVGDRGTGEGTGWTLNVPLPAGTTQDAYRVEFRDALDTAWKTADPDFVIISAGFDAMAGDPLGDMLLEPEDFHGLTRAVLERAGDIGVVAVLEGGYDPKRTAQGALAVVRALARLEYP